MRLIDLPPVWLVLCIGLAWLSPWQVPWGPALLPGLCVVALAAALMLAALLEFYRAGTTVIPRQSPDALITGGIFRISRNPIYLADALFLLGATLVMGRWLGFALVPLFGIFLDRRFVRGEEDRLRAAFGEAFEAYASRTRRWL